jgi:hypothetical protein
VLVDAAPLRLLAAAPIPCPPGFVLLLRALRPLLGGGDAALQAVPFACALLQIPLLGWLALRLTRQPALGLLAATLLAGSPVLAVFSLRVKQFSLDALLTLVLLLLAAGCIERPRVGRFATLCATAVAAPLLSFPSILVGPPLLLGAAWALARERRDGAFPLRRAALLGTALSGAGLAALAGALLVGRGNPRLFAHWHDFYLPLASPAALPAFLGGAGARFFALALPEPLGWAGWLVPVGLWDLLRRAEGRALGAALGAIYLGVAAASALGRFPVGGGRTDLFSYPVTLVLIVAAVAVPGRRWRAVPLAAAAVAIAALGWSLREGPVEYPPTGAAAVVRRAAAAIRPEDGLVVYPWSNWAVAHYGPWPVRLFAVGDSTSGFYAEPRRPHTLVLRESLGGTAFDADPEVVRRQLAGYLPQAPRRIHYLALWGPGAPHEWIVAALRAAGYRARGGEAVEGSVWLEWEREAP